MILTAPLLYRFAEVEVIASDIAVLATLPTEFLDGFAQDCEIWHIAGFQVVAEFFLDGRRCPEAFLTVLECGLKKLREHHFGGRLLLVLTIVALDLLLILRSKPIDAIGLVQFSYGLSEHLPVRDAPAHIHLARHLHTEVSARAVARGQRGHIVGGGDKRTKSRRQGVLV